MAKKKQLARRKTPKLTARWNASVSDRWVHAAWMAIRTELWWSGRHTLTESLARSAQAAHLMAIAELGERTKEMVALADEYRLVAWSLVSLQREIEQYGGGPDIPGLVSLIGQAFVSMSDIWVPQEMARFLHEYNHPKGRARPARRVKIRAGQSRKT